MNRIFEKLKPKRRYRRHPTCANKQKLCSYSICRCNYALDLRRAIKKQNKPVLAMILENDDTRFDLITK